MSKYKNKGFTLIELLVVIAIIGLLASIVLVSLNSARAKARDAKRKGDLKQIEIALEMYYDDHGTYPVVTSWAYSCNSSWNALQTALSPYIATLPKDPINTSCSGPWNVGYYTYVYGYPQGAFPQKYDLIGALENTSDPSRCGVQDWKYHTAGEAHWCTAFGGSYWNQLIADH